MRFEQSRKKLKFQNDFFDRLAHAGRGVLLLDYDGTLAPFCTSRNEAFPYPGIPELLDEIIETGHCRLVMISGRSIDDLLPLLKMKNRAEIWGSHGMERMKADGTRSKISVPREEMTKVETLKEWAKGEGIEGFMESKPHGAAFHFRGRSKEDEERVYGVLRSQWGPDFQAAGLGTLFFNGGIEFKVSGIDKGRAVNEILGEEESDCPMAYLGDDETDEDAFRALGSRGLKVLVREQYRESLADYWIIPPEELKEFLNLWKESII